MPNVYANIDNEDRTFYWDVPTECNQWCNTSIALDLDVSLKLTQEIENVPQLLGRVERGHFHQLWLAKSRRPHDGHLVAAHREVLVPVLRHFLIVLAHLRKESRLSL